MQSVSSSAVYQTLGKYFNRQEQAWNTTHSYTLDVNGSYVVFLLSPFMLATDIWFVKARHSSGISGYWQSIMKSAYNANYNLSITGDTLTITGDSCQTCLVQINHDYA